MLEKEKARIAHDNKYDLKYLELGKVQDNGFFRKR